jgi:hypothetical protein
MLSTWRCPVAVQAPDGGLFYGRVFFQFSSWLTDKIVDIKPDIIAFESPLPVVGFGTKARKFQTTSHTVRLLHGLVAEVERLSESFRITCLERSATDVKAHFAGSSSATKEAILRRCRQLRWPAANDDEADAAALWALIKSETERGWNYEIGPLFDRAQT